MGARSYHISVVEAESGKRTVRHGHIQIKRQSPISGAADDEAIIRTATLNAFPNAVEYLPIQIPNRQYRSIKIQNALQNFTDFVLKEYVTLLGEIEGADLEKEALASY